MKTTQVCNTTVQLKSGMDFVRTYSTSDWGYAVDIFIRDLLNCPQLIVLQIGKPEVLVTDEVATALGTNAYMPISDWLPGEHSMVYIIGQGHLFRVADGVLAEGTITVDEIFLEDWDGTEREGRYVCSITRTDDERKVIVENILGALHCPEEILKKLTT